jgi:Tfp pilus assembly protein PilO
VILLAGEWVDAWLAMSVTFLVAALGVVGLGWWVLRKDALNRAAETEAEKAELSGYQETHPKSGH